jgi:transposase-like protein
LHRRQRSPGDVIGIGIETADMLVSEVLSLPMRDRKAVARYAGLTRLAYMTFPAQHRTKLHSTNPHEHLNKEVERRADGVGIFPTRPALFGIGAFPLV